MIDPALIRHAVPERILTPRLELRRDAVEDAPAVFAAVDASRGELAPWLDWVTPAYDLGEAVRGQRRSREYWDAGDSFQWRIWQRGEADASTPPADSTGSAAAAFLGSIDLHSIDWDQRTAELGYWLDSRAQGQGFIVEAAPPIVEVAFGLLGFARLAIRCHPENARSITAAQRMGFAEVTRDRDGTVCLSRNCP
jgi:RimJ/RimL family protein N-acetyltransferase